MASSILSGVRIVDLTAGVAGPLATRLLAEAGADVVKVEPPSGERTRVQPAAFQNWNRSKRGIVLDVTTPAGREELDALLGTAEVLLHPFTPARAAALGLSDGALAARHPHLITSSVTGYPVGHADAERPAYDVLVQARSGMMDEQLGHRPGPIFIRFPLPSWATMYLVVAGILGRLAVRDRTGRAGPVHTSLMQGTMAVLAMLWNRAEHPSEAMELKLPLPKPFPYPAMQLYRCADGTYLQIVSQGLMEVAPIIEAVVATGAELPGPMTPPNLYRDLMVPIMASRRREEWLEVLRANDVPLMPVWVPGEALNSDQAVLNRYSVDLDDPVLGRIRTAGAPYAVDPPWEVRGPAPSLGQHGEEVRAEVAAWAPRTPGEAPVASSAPGPYPQRHLLEGVKVLDLGMFLAGPLAPMLMADLGADVIKVEPPTGDRMRTSETLFVGCQRGKRSIAVDLADPASRPVLERLVRWADVVHHNLRMPAARRLHLGYEDLKAINPAIVYCHVSSYGPDGAWKDWPGYDPTGQAASGWMWAGGGEGNPPMWHRFGMMDHQCAMGSLAATMLGLVHRGRTGEGSMVSSSLHGGATLTTSETSYLLDEGTFSPIPALDATQTEITPGYAIYEVADGWVAVAALGTVRAGALRAVAGVEVDAGLRDALRARGVVELLAALGAADVPAERVELDHEAAFFDDLEHRRSGLSVSYPHPVYGRFEQPGAFWDLGDLEVALDLAPPTLGQHSREVLRQVGFDDAAAQRLIDDGIVVESDLAVWPG